jgi:uncharacterized protein (DUF885 family)
MVTFLQSEYLPNSRETSGIGQVEGRNEQVLVKKLTTTNKTPEEIHQLDCQRNKNKI